jgi:hypothetical protein
MNNLLDEQEDAEDKLVAAKRVLRRAAAKRLRPSHEQVALFDELTLSGAATQRAIHRVADKLQVVELQLLDMEDQFPEVALDACYEGWCVVLIVVLLLLACLWKAALEVGIHLMFWFLFLLLLGDLAAPRRQSIKGVRVVERSFDTDYLSAIKLRTSSSHPVYKAIHEYLVIFCSVLFFFRSCSSFCNLHFTYPRCVRSFCFARMSTTSCSRKSAFSSGINWKLPRPERNSTRN